LINLFNRWRKGYCLVPIILKAIALIYLCVKMIIIIRIRWRKGYCLVPIILKAIALIYLCVKMIIITLAQRLLPCADYP